ncbi:MAG: amidohydrolase [Burkholderiaceae bacterium]|nr:amidohydrolase [Burkholderiaceae bacterium]
MNPASLDHDPGHGAPTLLFTNAEIVTLDPARPRARSLAVRGEHIVALSADPRPHAQPGVRQIDCGGATLLPGFIDAHLHLSGWARTLTEPDFGAAATLEQLQQALQALVEARPVGTWITARGYDEHRLGRHPTRQDLDAVAPAHPVSVLHRSGHAQVLNTLALRRVGIAACSGDIEAGLIDREPHSGEPTGLLFGMHRYVAARIPRRDGTAVDAGIARAGRKLLACGITSLLDTSPANDLARLEALRRWRHDGLVHTRIAAVLGWDAFAALDASHVAALAADPTIRLGGVKLTIQELTGRQHPDDDELARRVARIHACGLQAIMHAVDPPAIEAACRAVERVLARAPRPDHRHRIEHAAVCPPPLARRIAATGIIVVTQPGFVDAHARRYLATVAAQDQPDLYPLATLHAAGVRVAGSSDVPAGPLAPLRAMRAAVTRRGQDGSTVAPRQAITPAQALSLYTTGAAHALRVEQDRGRLSPGRLADFIGLSEPPDPAAAELPEIRFTVVGGRVFDNDDRGPAA